MRAVRPLAVAAFAMALVVVAGGAACPRRGIRPLSPVAPSRFWNMPQRALCEGQLGAPETVGALESGKLDEASGVVTSPSHPGVLWMHNDSGDTARVFAVSTSGGDLGQLALPGIEAVDWEDISAGPCPDLSGPCIFVADTGDNALSRDGIVVYAFPEPDVDVEHPLPDGATASKVWTFPLHDADGPVNIEAFVVLPDASAMVFYEKTNTLARIFKYAAPWTPDTLETLEVTRTFTPPGSVFGGANLPTGADVHTTGTRLLLRTYGGVFEAELKDGLTADTVDGSDFVEVAVNPADEPQGEAVGYDEDGTGYFLVSETAGGPDHQPLDHASCE